MSCFQFEFSLFLPDVVNHRVLFLVVRLPKLFQAVLRQQLKRLVDPVSALSTHPHARNPVLE